MSRPGRPQFDESKADALLKENQAFKARVAESDNGLDDQAADVGAELAELVVREKERLLALMHKSVTEQTDSIVMRVTSESSPEHSYAVMAAFKEMLSSLGLENTYETDAFFVSREDGTSCIPAGTICVEFPKTDATPPLVYLDIPELPGESAHDTLQANLLFSMASLADHRIPLLNRADELIAGELARRTQ